MNIVWEGIIFHMVLKAIKVLDYQNSSGVLIMKGSMEIV